MSMNLKDVYTIDKLIRRGSFEKVIEFMNVHDKEELKISETRKSSTDPLTRESGKDLSETQNFTIKKSDLVDFYCRKIIGKANSSSYEFLDYITRELWNFAKGKLTSSGSNRTIELISIK